MKPESLPPHLRKYIVQQDQTKYSPIDQAVWRYALRQLKNFLSIHAHPAYIDGLKNTGISIDSIPSIEEISSKLAQFGWTAIPVSGFIPPAAFMELQALNILPIASDIRSLSHLAYTPAPDIIHEAAGHAPMLAHPEFSKYLMSYAQVARKAIISSEDLKIYAAIRDLSDIKENPQSTNLDIQQAEKNLATALESATHVSEATWLSRMNWWTAEYGLIGDINNPKILGAGLLSSVGEARWCLDSHVKKLPLTVDCINFSYDITEPQPQLFVTPDFKTLQSVLDDLAKKMAFKIGGIEGLKRAHLAQTVNSMELNSGLQVSGKCTDLIFTESNQLAYIKFSGPCQLAVADKELSGHGTSYHHHGFGTPIGELSNFPNRCPSELSDSEWSELGAKPHSKIVLNFASGLRVEGIFNGRLQFANKTILLSLTEASARLGSQILFEPDWGTFDIAIGSTISSVFGGPADRTAYGDTEDFKAARVPTQQPTALELELRNMYQEVRDLRNTCTSYTSDQLEQQILLKKNALQQKFPNDWLLNLELYELALQNGLQHSRCTKEILEKLIVMSDKNSLIQDGIKLAHQP